MRSSGRGIEALKLYRAEYDSRLEVLSSYLVHDWSMHAADAFRYLAMTLDRGSSAGSQSKDLMMGNLIAQAQPQPPARLPAPPKR